jgi:hypothetical protein
MLTAAPPRGYEFLSSSPLQFPIGGLLPIDIKIFTHKKPNMSTKAANRRVSLLDFGAWLDCSLNESVTGPQWTPNGSVKSLRQNMRCERTERKFLGRLG